MTLPFDSRKLDRLMEEASVDVILATSGHNVRYLLGGYRFFFFEHFAAIGISAYLPCVGYPRGRPDAAFYVANPMETRSLDADAIWIPKIEAASWTTIESAQTAATLLRHLGLHSATIAVERAFLPCDAWDKLTQELPRATFVEAFPLLAELRAIKTPTELTLLRRVADEIVDSMLSVIDSGADGLTTHEVAERLRFEETKRGLLSEYCLVAVGPSTLRAPSGLRWRRGHGVSLDSGASLRGYIGDLARMGCLGQPSERMQDLLAQVDSVQQAARAQVAPGRNSSDVFGAALTQQNVCRDGGSMSFVAHGMGLVAHEVPFLTQQGGVPYPAVDRHRPFAPGMVLSLETELVDAEVGFVKLEDTLAVTDSGHDAYGDRGRGWNMCA